jgi:hypothetical protein
VDHCDSEVTKGNLLAVREVPIALETEAIGVKIVDQHRRFSDVSHFMGTAGMVWVKVSEKNVSDLQPQSSYFFYYSEYFSSRINNQAFLCLLAA